MKVYTIGYGGRTPEELLRLLVSHGIRTVVDVRLRPDQSTFGAYVRSKSKEKGIERLLREEGIDYLSRIELGNLFLECADWPARYRRLLEQAGDLLLEGLSGLPDPICLLCAERRAERCHRLLIGAALAERGDLVEHIA